MPIYRFETTNHETTLVHDVSDLSDLSAARKAATDYVGELVKQLDGKLFNHALALRVTDENNEMVFLVTVVARETQTALS